MSAPPRFILALTGLLSLFVLASGVYGLVAAIGAGAYFRIGFEIVIVLAGVIGIFTAMNRFASGPAWAMTCIAGAVVAAGMFAFFTRGGRPAVIGWRLIMDMLRDPLAASRLTTGAAFLLLAGLTLMLRAPRIAFKRFAIGCALLAPVALLAGLWIAGPLRSLIYSLHPIAQLLLAIVGFFVIGAAISIGLHLIIRALEAGVEDHDGDASLNGAANA